ncbi:transglutaminase family protein [Massilia terrae]|uniref:Transglutaminase family protein n=1 Tax=Massilia terrae TaxID=1811224 RepID=A0ABT2CTL9_9BURK|nr:transglutaminase family protein [Massilia terrae]MCS0657311.1 transglutaminase family protein [Massilia terrae]
MNDSTTSQGRRALLKSAGGALLFGALPQTLLAQAQQAERHFDPQPGDWRTFEVVTRVELAHGNGPSTVWVPVPSIDTPWQRSISSNWSGNAAAAKLGADPRFGARYLVADFDGSKPPVLEVASRVQTRSRAQDWRQAPAQTESAQDLQMWLRPTDLMPTDGIVRKTSLQIVSGARTDVEKVQRIYDWIVLNTFREPKVRGCGTGDIKTMLETGNFGGKCGDINGLFVGLCRAAGVPARDVYGIRLAPSAFGYNQLGASSASLQGAQHCRAEVYLRKHGWVAMDPADVGKVMRMETATWIKDADNPLVAPVRKALFGGWEGNWMGYNFAHDVQLQGAHGAKVGFLMYPQAQTNGEAYDSLDPASFKYTISAREIKA